MTKLEIFYTVLGVITGIFIGLVPFFKSLVAKTETTIDDKILEIAISVVNYYEDNFKYKDGANKKARAVSMLGMKLANEGIKATTETVSKAVEDAVTLVEVDKLNKEKDNKESDMGK